MLGLWQTSGMGLGGVAQQLQDSYEEYLSSVYYHVFYRPSQCDEAALKVFKSSWVGRSHPA